MSDPSDPSVVNVPVAVLRAVLAKAVADDFHGCYTFEDAGHRLIAVQDNVRCPVTLYNRKGVAVHVYR